MRLLTALVTITALTAVIIGTSGAFFQDQETSSNNLLQAASLDLLVNGQNNPSTLIDLTNLQPGEREQVNKTLRINDQPGNIYFQINDLSSSQGTNTSQEIDEEATTWGGPKSDLENHIHIDLGFNQQIIIDQTDSIIINQITDCWIPVGTIEGGVDISMVQGFTLDDQVTNWAHGDEINFTEQFLAIQTDATEAPISDSGKIWDQATLSCITAEVTPTTTPTPPVEPTPTNTPTPTPTNTPTPTEEPTPSPTPEVLSYTADISFTSSENVLAADFIVNISDGTGTIDSVICGGPKLTNFGSSGNNCVLADLTTGGSTGEKVATVTVSTNDIENLSLNITNTGFSTNGGRPVNGLQIIIAPFTLVPTPTP